MKNIIDYIKKNEKHQTKLFNNYPKWRYLVGLVEDKVKLEELTKSAASWFSRKSLVWPYIVDLFVFDDKLYIVTTRPGLIIGKSGEDIDSLVKHVGVRVELIEAGNDCPVVALRNSIMRHTDYLDYI